MRAATLEEFARDPVRRYVSDATFLHFCAHPALWGILLWGRPTATDARHLGRSLVFELAPPAEPHVSIVDASRLEGGDEGAFQALEHFVTHSGEELRRWVLRLALVRPRGLHGAVVAGAYEVMPRPYPVGVFDEVPKALAWLREEKSFGASPVAMLNVLSELQTVAAHTPPLLGLLKALLDGHLEGLSVADAARALGSDPPAEALSRQHHLPGRDDRRARPCCEGSTARPGGGAHDDRPRRGVCVAPVLQRFVSAADRGSPERLAPSQAKRVGPLLTRARGLAIATGREGGSRSRDRI